MWINSEEYRNLKHHAELNKYRLGEIETSLAIIHGNIEKIAERLDVKVIPNMNSSFIKQIERMLDKLKLETPPAQKS